MCIVFYLTGKSLLGNFKKQPIDYQQYLYLTAI